MKPPVRNKSGPKSSALYTFAPLGVLAPEYSKTADEQLEKRNNDFAAIYKSPLAASTRKRVYIEPMCFNAIEKDRARADSSPAGKRKERRAPIRGSRTNFPGSTSRRRRLELKQRLCADDRALIWKGVERLDSQVVDPRADRDMADGFGSQAIGSLETVE